MTWGLWGSAEEKEIPRISNQRVVDEAVAICPTLRQTRPVGTDYLV